MIEVGLDKSHRTTFCIEEGVYIFLVSEVLTTLDKTKAHTFVEFSGSLSAAWMEQRSIARRGEVWRHVFIVQIVHT